MSQNPAALSPAFPPLVLFVSSDEVSVGVEGRYEAFGESKLDSAFAADLAKVWEVNFAAVAKYKVDCFLNAEVFVNGGGEFFVCGDEHRSVPLE